jgi:hypothetical protein
MGRLKKCHQIEQGHSSEEDKLNDKTTHTGYTKKYDIKYSRHVICISIYLQCSKYLTILNSRFSRNPKKSTTGTQEEERRNKKL